MVLASFFSVNADVYVGYMACLCSCSSPGQWRSVGLSLEKLLPQERFSAGMSLMNTCLACRPVTGSVVNVRQWGIMRAILETGQWCSMLLGGCKTKAARLGGCDQWTL